MKKLVLLLSVICLSCSENSLSQFKLEEAFPNLSFINPVDLQHSGDGTDRIFVVEQTGIIYVFDNTSSVTLKKKFLDISDSVSSGGEMGLLGLAFHPNYKNNGFFYVNYTKSQPVRRTIIARFKVSSSNPDSADRSSSKILMEIVQPYSNHNGGQVAFGPDGFLYIGLGDGGSGGDPQNNAQNKSSLLGKILRIDVDNVQSSLNYGIPVDNPFKNNSQGYREEIYAYGLRNPWKFSFDFTTGRLWCADVGQNAWEEIDLITSGGNYGWRCYEGNHEYNLTGCTGSDYIPPIWEYSHNEGISITGGFVYRGPNIPELFGKYIYADYGSRKIWALTYDGVNSATNQLLTTASGTITSFGTDMNDELYICSFNGRIYRFTPTADIVAPSNLRANFLNENSIQLNWNDNSKNEDGFNIERRSGTSNFEVIGTVNSDITSYVDNNIVDTILYSYRINAYNSSSSSGYSNITSIVTQVRSEINQRSKGFKLNQNYPNPFNPQTVIGMQIPHKSHIILKVFDVLGKQVATLLSEEKEAGFYEVKWNSENSSSGVYLYTLQAENYSESKKMIILQ